MIASPQPPMITRVQYLQLLGQHKQAERHVRQLAEMGATGAARVTWP